MGTVGELVLSSDHLFAKSLSTPKHVEETCCGRRKLPNWLMTDKIKFQWREREILLQADADGNTRLHVAISLGLQRTALKIIEFVGNPNSVFVNTRNAEGSTALHLAVLNDMQRVVWRLVAVGARVDVVDGAGRTPLHIACRDGNGTCARALLVGKRIERCVNLRDGDNRTCIQLAALKNHQDLVQLLKLSAGQKGQTHSARL
jgi:ankyrin repeat protein